MPPVPQQGGLCPPSDPPNIEQGFALRGALAPSGPSGPRPLRGLGCRHRVAGLRPAGPPGPVLGTGSRPSLRPLRASCPTGPSVGRGAKPPDPLLGASPLQPQPRYGSAHRLDAATGLRPSALLAAGLRPAPPPADKRPPAGAPSGRLGRRSATRRVFDSSHSARSSPRFDSLSLALYGHSSSPRSSARRNGLRTPLCCHASVRWPPIMPRRFAPHHYLRPPNSGMPAQRCRPSGPGPLRGLFFFLKCK